LQYRRQPWPVVSLPSHPAGRGELAIARLVSFRLNGQGARRRDRVFLGAEREIEILLVEAHERLAGLDILPNVNEALDHLARNAKAEIALDARRNDARECPLGYPGRLCDGGLDKPRSLARIGLRCRIWLAADRRHRTKDHGGGTEGDNSGQGGRDGRYLDVFHR
jgi:hypothetical protein